MDEIARVYAEALFDSAKDSDKLDAIREQLAEFADALAESRDMQVFFFSPYFSSKEKREGLERAVSGAEPQLQNFLALLVEKHRMPVIFRIRRKFEELWAAENKRIDVTVTSAVGLDEKVIEQIGSEIEKQTGQKVELSSNVDESVLGGLVVQVGNMVLDASIRNRLEKLRKGVARTRAA
jgi:F-type H+-transporting ATPase subunit delta